jgi:DNA-binding NarL/FixJ family response regulator
VGEADRKKELLDAFLDGESLEGAATRLGVGSRTVKHHQVNLLRKLGVESRLAIVRLLR